MKLAELRAVPQDEPAPRSRWPRRLAAAVVLIACVAVGIVVLRSPAPVRRPLTPVQAAPPAAAPVVPVAPPVDVSIPSTTPPGLVWSVFAGVWEPTHPTAGPLHVTGAVASGYERSPLGAVIAAQQIETRAAAAPQGGWRAVTLAQVVPGPIRARYLQQRANVSDAAPAGGWGQPVAFRYVTWTPDQAVVQLLVHFAGRQDYQGATFTMRWQDSDWKLLLDTPTPPIFTAPSPTGFVLWGAPNA